MRTYVADTPGDSALLARGGCLIGLALDAQVHDVITADGTVVDDDVPRPERDCVPLSHVSMSRAALRSECAYLLDLEALLVVVTAGASLVRLGLRRGRVRHVDVGHV
jgi:hypothetical protein